MPLDSNDLYASHVNILYCPEQHIQGVGLNDPASRGAFIVPSEVPGRSDITGYVLRAVGNDGKVEWAPSPAFSLTLGELADVNLTGLMNGDTIIYDAATQFWVPGSGGTSVVAGDALQFTGTTLNVLYDNININTNTLNQLQLIDHSITNSKLVNSSISINSTGGLAISGSPVSLGGNIDIGVDASVIRTTGGQTINGSLELKSLIIENATATNTITLEAPTTITADYTLVLPQSQATGTQLLENDGTGSLSWVTATVVAPGGANTNIQFNDSGAFGGSNNFTFDGTNVTLTNGTLFAKDVIMTSDARLKSDITYVDDLKCCMDMILQLKPCQYKFTEGSGAPEFGFIAQDLEEIPSFKNFEFVREINGTKGVDYIKLIPILVGAVKELIHHNQLRAPSTRILEL